MHHLRWHDTHYFKINIQNKEQQTGPPFLHVIARPTKASVSATDHVPFSCREEQWTQQCASAHAPGLSFSSPPSCYDFLWSTSLVQPSATSLTFHSCTGFPPPQPDLILFPNPSPLSLWIIQTFSGQPVLTSRQWEVKGWALRGADKEIEPQKICWCNQNYGGKNWSAVTYRSLHKQNKSKTVW